MGLVEQWVSDPYLTDRKIRSLVESARAKPVSRYLVLDDFFRVEALERLREHCLTYVQFAEDDKGLPYDSDFKFADANDVGWDLFGDPTWHAYCAHLVGVTLSEQPHHSVKLRKHRPNAAGFWIHTDAVPGRSLLVVAYFNKGWKVDDGSLLQIWRDTDPVGSNVPEIRYDGRMNLDVLQTSVRIRTNTPGGGNLGRQIRDFTLIDQIVPEYNRLVICNLQTSPVWHSVTPNNGRPRYGFVQWIA